MTWIDWHRKSEVIAGWADQNSREGNSAIASKAYLEAAVLEEKAFDNLDGSQPRTLGIISVSAASLYLKASDLPNAERFSLVAMNHPALPSSARFQLRQVLQDAWVSQDRLTAEVGFLPGQVQISVSGGQVVYGGAPLDLIVDKVKGVQSLFYRTVEHLREEPLRLRGEPRPEVQRACRPWLFQAPPGSYQFSVAVQKPDQQDFFRKDVEPERVVAEFMGVLRAGAANDVEALKALVPDEGYRRAFLRLTRNLSPSGKTFDVLDVRVFGATDGVRLGRETHAALGKRIKEETSGIGLASDKRETLYGILRAVHLDDDWLGVATDESLVRITGVQDSMDDIIGPMINRSVIATVLKRKKQILLLDIELHE